MRKYGRTVGIRLCLVSPAELLRLAAEVDLERLSLLDKPTVAFCCLAQKKHSVGRRLTPSTLWASTALQGDLSYQHYSTNKSH